MNKCMSSLSKLHAVSNDHLTCMLDSNKLYNHVKRKRRERPDKSSELYDKRERPDENPLRSNPNASILDSKL